MVESRPGEFNVFKGRHGYADSGGKIDPCLCKPTLGRMDGKPRISELDECGVEVGSRDLTDIETPLYELRHSCPQLLFRAKQIDISFRYEKVCKREAEPGTDLPRNFRKLDPGRVD